MVSILWQSLPAKYLHWLLGGFAMTMALSLAVFLLGCALVAAWLALRTGAIQAFAQDGAKLGALLATLPNRDQFEISPFTPTREYMGVGVPKGEERLRAAIDQILLELEKGGTAARIYDKYFGPKSQAPLARDFTIGSTVK